MKKFIVSDLHGNGNVYLSIMNYLENVYKDENLILYINGDLIDRGIHSAQMLLDVQKRIINKESFDIKYLGGNHELMMYRSLNGAIPDFIEASLWFSNGGGITNDAIQDLLDKKQKLELLKFISELDIYHKFDEKLNDKNIVLVHAKCPSTVKDTCDLKIKNNYEIYDYVWTREDELSLNETLGNKDYFTIIGHTSVIDPKGYKYLSDYNCLNIDGGCSAYALGYKQIDHVPLVEIDDKNNRLIILTFNSKNEIICGNYFENNESIKMNFIELNNKRKLLDKDVNIKKLEYM